MLYLIVETSVILLAASVVFFLLGAYYQRHFATAAKEEEETTGAWDMRAQQANDEEKDWLRQRVADLEGQLAVLAESPRTSEPVMVDMGPALGDVESRLQVFVDQRFQTLEARLSELHVTVATPAGSTPVKAAGPDVATLNAISAVERRLTQAMATEFARLHQTLPQEVQSTPAPSVDHLSAVVERFAQELASVESRLTAMVIDQMSAQPAHRDPAVDIRQLAESFQRLENEIASGVHVMKAAEVVAPDHSEAIRSLSESMERLEHAVTSKLYAPAPEVSHLEHLPLPDHSAELRSLADAYTRLERHVVQMSDAPVNVTVNLDEVNRRFDALEHAIASAGAAQTAARTSWESQVVPAPTGPALWNEDAQPSGEPEEPIEPTVVLEPKPVPVPTEPTLAPLMVEPSAPPSTVTEKQLEQISASVAALEAGTRERFNGLERQIVAAASVRHETPHSQADERLERIERRLEEMVARAERPLVSQPSAEQPPKELEQISASVAALEAGTRARFDGLERQIEAAGSVRHDTLNGQADQRLERIERRLDEMYARTEQALAPAPTSAETPKELEQIYASVAALEAGTHARFDGLERQIIAASSGKPEAPHRNSADERLERIERRLEEISVRAEHTATSFHSVATGDSVDQLGEEFRDNAATLERRTIALEVELVRHRELLKSLAENTKPPEPAPPVDPTLDPAVIALTSAKEELSARIDSIRTTIDQHVAAAELAEVPRAPVDHTPELAAALEAKLDGMSYRLEQSLQGRSDTAPMIEALRMDLAGLRVALLQSVAANRGPSAELHGIRTELERLRASMHELGREHPVTTSRETELALRLGELERRSSEREHEFEERERRLDNEYQERVVALERELESLEQKLEREEREDAKVSAYDDRSQRLEEREHRISERENALNERLTALEREVAETSSNDPEVAALRERLALAEATLARAAEDRREEEIRRELERRMDERLAETQRDSRDLREELRDISTMLQEAPEPKVAPVVVAPSEPSVSKEIITRMDRLEDLLWEATAEAKRASATKPAVEKPEPQPQPTLPVPPPPPDLNALVAKFEQALTSSNETMKTFVEGRLLSVKATLEHELSRRENANPSVTNERLEQLRMQLTMQLERHTADMKEAERDLAERFDVRLERSLEGIAQTVRNEFAPRLDGLQMAMRHGTPITVMGQPSAVVAESDHRAMDRLEDRLRSIESSLLEHRSSGMPDESRQMLERERQRLNDELRESERRSRDHIRKLERELDAARVAQAVPSKDDLNDYREEDMPRGRFGMGGGFMDPSRILEELDHRLSEAEERFEKLSKESGNVAALEAALKSEREAREELEDRIHDMERGERERQMATETALERVRNEQGRSTMDLRSEMRRELDDRLRDAEDRITRRAAPAPAPVMQPPVMPQPMMGYGMGGGDAFAMNAMHDMDRRLREAMDTLRAQESTLNAHVDESIAEAFESLEQRIEAMREDAQLSEPINAALRAFRERLESAEKSIDERVEDNVSSVMEKLEDRLRELENKSREQASGMYADIDDLRRTLATERRSIEEKIEARLEGVHRGGEETEKLRQELADSNDRTQKQLLAVRDYVVRLDKTMKPLEERVGSFESQIGARVEQSVTPEMIELIGDRLTRLEVAPKGVTMERVDEVTAALESLRTVFSNALTRLDGMETRVSGVTSQIGQALNALKEQAEERIEDLVAHIDHLQEEMREEASERTNTVTEHGVEPTELRRVEEEDMRRFQEVQERFERLEKSFGAKFESVKHDLETNIHHSEERAHDDALSLTARSDERLEKMVGGLEKLVAEKENIIAELSERVKSLTDQVHQNPDDLTDIAGIGPKLKKRLKEEFGITTFKMLATISASDLERMAGMLLFPDRIFREDWIGQARELHLRKYNELLPPNEAEGEMRMRMAS